MAYGDTLDAKQVVGPDASLGAGVAIYLRPAEAEKYPSTKVCDPTPYTTPHTPHFTLHTSYYTREVP